MAANEEKLLLDAIGKLTDLSRHHLNMIEKLGRVIVELNERVESLESDRDNARACLGDY